MYARKLKTLIEENRPLIVSGMVCYCYFDTEKCTQVAIDKLSKEELDKRFKNSEWWIEDGDLCLMEGRR